MGYNAHYWTRKDELKDKAAKHTANMISRFSPEIKKCQEESVIYTSDVSCGATGNYKEPSIEIIDTDTVSCIFNNTSDKETVTILSFASYNNAGGGFMNGSSAQEEMLCHSSFLFNILMWESDYYSWNNAHKNKGMYTNRALYSPNVLFFNEDKYRKINVITCAAPNKSLIYRYNSFTEEENSVQLRSRIKFIKNIAENNVCDTLILGAFGCGVFAQDPVEVASLFKEMFSKTNIKRIIYAIPAGKNLEAFREVFSNYETDKNT